MKRDCAPAGTLGGATGSVAPSLEAEGPDADEGEGATAVRTVDDVAGPGEVVEVAARVAGAAAFEVLCSPWMATSVRAKRATALARRTRAERDLGRVSRRGKRLGRFI